MSALDHLHQTVLSCSECPLHAGRTNAVPGEGDTQAQLMFVGEGPGYHEDRLGRPFVGQSGQFLNELLKSIGLKREDVFITNMVKCRPPNNRDPFPAEINACRRYLDEQIRLINPKMIIPLGRHALSKWFPNETIGKVRARPRHVEDRIIFPLYHPAAALHNHNLRQTIEQDFLKAGKLLHENSNFWEKKTDIPGEQLSMS